MQLFWALEKINFLKITAQALEAGGFLKVLEFLRLIFLSKFFLWKCRVFEKENNFFSNHGMHNNEIEIKIGFREKKILKTFWQVKRYKDVKFYPWKLYHQGLYIMFSKNLSPIFFDLSKRILNKKMSYFYLLQR